MYLAEVTSSQDVPGFVSNALLMPFINEVRYLTARPLLVLALITTTLPTRRLRPYMPGYYVSGKGPFIRTFDLSSR